MKRKAVIITRLWLLAGCRSLGTVVTPTDVFVPVTPNAALYAECPMSIPGLPSDTTSLSDKQANQIFWSVYRNWKQCQKAVSDIQTDVTNQAAKVTASNSKTH